MSRKNMDEYKEKIVDELPHCDICDQDHKQKAFVEGKTIFGPWANMCGLCHLSHGIGFGEEKGKILIERKKK